MLVLRAIIILCVPVIIDASIWGYWGSCGKTCGIGTQIRQRINSAGNVLESEKQYCNTQPCPGTCNNVIKLKHCLNLKKLFGSSNPSTVGKQKSSKCEFRAFQRLDWIKKTGYGREEYTSELLRSITEDFGPITSFTGYYQLSDKLVFRIILHVGGNPLQVIPFRDTYMVSSNCTEGILDCPLMNQQLSSPSGVQKGSWTQWSSCTKTCNIGTQTRCRYNKTLQKIEYEEQYCNTQYCPGEDLSCNMTTDCPRQAGWSYNIECKNHVCRCSLGDGHNKYNCFGEVGNCVIREKSQTALGYAPLESYLELKSCTTNDNTRYELHVISTFGGPNDVFEITIKPRGPVIKPIILVLMSDLSIIWKIDTPVGLYKVLYGGRDYGNRTVVKVVKNSSSKCSFEATKRSDIAHNINNDVKVLTKLSYEFGPITSYTRLFPISDASWITLEVGGFPLQVLTRDYRYDASQLSCESPTPPPP
ncbi:Hypothetical predicted protein [Mytilus galloprovincialis]|uniref:Uncharacterized protein n=1 Tax=Mytilus galloprovincialis TaxID=29158 RepID=A0A8B6ECN1_MYTGA|nr:Hypothetical predicted protein [Mytilus galloprovincialis]